MAKTGRAVLYKETDDQYSLLIFSRASDDVEEQLDSTTPNLTLATAFNTARDALAAMPVGAEKHKLVTIATRIL
jgi:hypothetical protein